MNLASDGPSNQTALQIGIFDTRRGDAEGEEAEKILGYFPASIPSSSQTAIVGLAQTFLNFTSIVSPEEPCDSIWTSNGRWILHNCEPHIWLFLIAGNDWQKGKAAYSSLLACLQQLHNLICLIHGPIQQLLDQNQSAEPARKAIADVVNEYGSSLWKLRGMEYIKITSALAVCGAMPLLQMPQPLLSRLQSIVHSIGALPIWNGSQVSGVLALHDHRLMYSTLSKEDTLALYQLASHVIMPAVKAGKQHSIANIWGSGNKVTAPSSLIHKSAWTLGSDGLVVRAHTNESQPTSTNAVGLMSHSSSTAELEKILPLASVWLQGRMEWCSLLILNVGDQLLLVALPESLPATVSAGEAVVNASAEPLKSLNSLVNNHLQTVRNYHVPSFRYLFTDGLTDGVRGYPGSKVATLAKQSLGLTSNLRSQVEDRSRFHKDAYLEVTVWGQNDCWVVARCRGQRTLYVVLEQRGNEGLIETCKEVDKFAMAQFAGIFD